MRCAGRFALSCGVVLCALVDPGASFVPGGNELQLLEGVGRGRSVLGATAFWCSRAAAAAAWRPRPRLMNMRPVLQTNFAMENNVLALWQLLRGVTVKSASSGEEMDLLSAWEPAPGKKTIVAFFTHTADFNSWEYAQKLRHYLPQIDDAGVGVVGVSLGTVDAARDFCAETGFPLDNMFMDATGQAYSALGFSNGFEPRLPGDRKINPYLRLLPMLAGIGSPGTIQAVLKGYVGDPNSNADWISSALSMVDNKEFNFLGTRGSRPLEVATLRLQNMRQIVTKWNKLAPPDKELITQQGGTVVFEGRDKIYSYKDKGILVYTDVLEMLKTIGVKL